MKPYGQFCSIAKALEAVGERWTPLVLRELICGATRYSEIQRGVPRMSPALLSKRLGTLERAGVVARDRDTGAYALTEAGWELKPVVEQLGVWGQRWARGRLTDQDCDPDLLMWDLRRRVNRDAFPENRTCLQFEFVDQPKAKRRYWLVGDRGGLDLCIDDPGFPVDLFVTTDARTMTLVWNGDLPLRRMIDDGRIELHGPPPLCRAFPQWLMLSLFAGVPAANRSTTGERCA
jgi:DNA-binding HxlR family transcriptional regulator